MYVCVFLKMCCLILDYISFWGKKKAGNESHIKIPIGNSHSPKPLLPGLKDDPVSDTSDIRSFISVYIYIYIFFQVVGKIINQFFFIHIIHFYEERENTSKIKKFSNNRR